jgi:hypothetical protein
MAISSNPILCDGCGLPASAEHVAERLDRLELATRFRPIHTNVLFVISDPMLRREDDFYRAPVAQDSFASLMEALQIVDSSENPRTGVDPTGRGLSALLEFQRRGYYLAYLSECPLAQRGVTSTLAEEMAIRGSISRLAPTLIKRIQFNYKPKHIVLLGANLHPVIEALNQVGLDSLLLLDCGEPLTLPQVGDGPSMERFREALASNVPRTKSFSGV